MSKIIEAEWLPAAKLAVFLNVSAMAIWRWERDPRLEFPQPTIINGRKYWNRTDINGWMRARALAPIEASRQPSETVAAA
jgi:predicted DNA-binding transcriptional regulator AlpA